MLHTGDFKMDQFPLDERITDLRGFARLGEEGVDLFLTDSTNAEVPGFTTSERDLVPAIETGVPHRAAPGHRLQLRQPRAPHPAGARRRRTPTAARSPSSAARWSATWASPATSATSTCPTGLVVDLKALEKLPANKVTLICTGSQGEPMAALSRMANRDHMIRIGEGDTVLLASSLIPGNENAIYRVINELTRWGANVVHKGNAKVHVSGHASAGELVYCYNIVQPRNVMPVHGEWRHLRANGDLAIRTGVAPERRRHRRGRRRRRPASTAGPKITGKVAGRQRLRRRRRPSAASPRPPSRTAAPWPRRASSPSSRSSTPTPARWPSRRTSWSAASSTTTTTFDAVVAADREGAGAGPPRRASATPHQLEQLIARDVGRWAHRAYRRSPMIIPIVIDA